MQLTSHLFTHQSAIPDDYTCKGRNTSPQLHIKDIPSEIKSLALVMHDPDAPNGDFTHWVVWNILPEDTTIQEGSVPDTALQGLSDFGTIGYGGPCPPSGTHHYVFELYALDRILDVPQGATRQAVETALRGHVIEHTQLIGLVSA
jgi:hypothetical protein